MYNKFCCAKCGDMMFNNIEWETFIDSKGVLGNKGFLQFTCCDSADRLEIDSDFDWKEWAQFENFKNKTKSALWQDLGNRLLGDL